ncbi:hypothetical protein O6H91_Y080800 [Diphasiastrum complanatum]|nr:hypothetical protein O6H91_Y080800 [Diphasiastrum complanatum]
MGWEGDAESRCQDLNSVSGSRKDYYKILGVDYDATDDMIRTNYLHLALKWHPDKHNGENAATMKFQEINEAYTVLSDPLKRHEHDMSHELDVQEYSVVEYLHRFKALILTCNGLGMGNLPSW